jgi:hypothetical protein
LFVPRTLGRAFEGSNCGLGIPGAQPLQALRQSRSFGVKKRSDFSSLGYIYSDWAKDGFDGKQLTVTTYI